MPYSQFMNFKIEGQQLNFYRRNQSEDWGQLFKSTKVQVCVDKQ